MARGFDSKAVSDQQDDMLRGQEPKQGPMPHTSARRRTLELARTDLLRRIEGVPENGRAQLRTALAALDDLISKS
jgi:hypothetical protein